MRNRGCVRSGVIGIGIMGLVACGVFIPRPPGLNSGPTESEPTQISATGLVSPGVIDSENTDGEASEPIHTSTRRAVDVRSGAPELPTVIASVPTNRDDNQDPITSVKNCIYHVFAVEATTHSTVVRWGISRNGVDGCQYLTTFVYPENLPALIEGGTVYRVLSVDNETSKAFGNDPLMSNPVWIWQEPRPFAAVYPALPPDAGQVTVRSPLFDHDIQVPVERWQALQRNADVPILGQVVYQNTFDEEDDTPILVTIHGVRRVPGGTAVYYSLGARASDSKSKLSIAGTGGALFQIDHLTDGNFDANYAVLDLIGMRGYEQLGQAAGPTLSDESPWHSNLDLFVDAEPRIGFSLIPEISQSVSVVDVVVGGHEVIQDVPVENGAMTPVANESMPLLGTGWPRLPDLSKAPEEWQVEDQARLIRAVTRNSVTKVDKRLELDANVLFAKDKADLTPAARTVIDEAVKQLTEAQVSGVVTVTGHTDSDGTEEYNMALSKRRAQAVADALRPKLPKSITLTVVGKGESEPIAKNDTEAGKRMNRRVTLTPPK